MHQALDVLDHDNRVVHDDADREYQTKQGQRVDGEAQKLHAGKGAHNGHRNGKQRHQSGTPALQEDEDHHQDQHDGFEQRVHHLFHRGFDEDGGVVRYRELDTRREGALQRLQCSVDACARVQRVAARGQVNQNERGRLAVQAAKQVIALRAQFDPRYVAHAHIRSIRIRAQHDLAELAGLLQAAFGDDRQCQFGRAVAGLLAHTTGCIESVLLRDGRAHIRNRHPLLRQAIRVQPDPHRIVFGAEAEDIARAWHALELIDNVGRRVVRQVDLVEARVIALQRHDHQQVGRGLRHNDALSRGLLRQLRFGQLDAVLNVHRGKV